MQEIGHVEYVITPGPGLRAWLIRIIFAATYLLVGSLLFSLSALLQIDLIFAIGLALIVIACLVLLTWRYTKVEYEISLDQETLTCARIFGKRSRMRMLTVNVKDFVLVGPLDDEATAEKGRRYPLHKEYRAVPAPDADNVWFAIWNVGKDSFAVFYFQATDPLLKAIRFQNPTAIAMRQ